MGAETSKAANLLLLGNNPLPIGELLAYHAARDPDKPAISFNGTTVSRAELDARSNCKARQLAGLGVGEQDIVTIALPNGVEFFETSLAVWKLGATVNPVSYRLPPAEISAIVEIARPRLVVGAAPVGQARWAHLAAQSEVSSEFSTEPLPTKIANIWKIMTSGGSTGRPKLIVDKRPGVFDPTTASAGMILDDTMLNPGPLYHNTPFVMSHSCLFTGGHVVEMGRFDALQALELIERYRVGWVSFVPTMMHRISRLPAEQRNAFDVSSLRFVFHMAAPCPPWLKEQWIKWLGPKRIFELYGGTELFGTTVISGIEWLSHRGSVGKPQGGAEMRIVDEEGRDCPPGVVGEIYFRPETGTRTSAYIGAEESSLDGFMSYGDLGHVDEDGYLYLAERRTDMILSGGANIYPAEIEGALDEHPDVRSSIVIGMPDEDLGQKTHAIVQVVKDARHKIDANALRAFLSDKLVRYKIPRTFEFTEENLRDDAGKARRTRMRDERIALAAEAAKI